MLEPKIRDVGQQSVWKREEVFSSDLEGVSLSATSSTCELNPPKLDLKVRSLFSEASSSDPAPDHRSDPKAYIDWAKRQSDVRIKEEALITLVGYLKENAAIVDRVDISNELESFYFSVVDELQKSKGPASFEGLRGVVSGISSLKLISHRYGYSSQLDASEHVLNNLNDRSKKIFEKAEALGGKCADGSCKPDIITFIKKNYPLDEPQTTWRARSPVWHKISGNTLKAATELQDDLDMLYLRNGKPYTMVEHEGSIYVRLDDFNASEFEKSGKDFLELNKELSDINKEIKTVRAGIERLTKEQGRFVAGLEKIFSEGYRCLAAASGAPMFASAGSVPVGRVAFLSPLEADFEKDVLLVEKFLAIGEAKRAKAILNSLYNKVEENKKDYSNAGPKLINIMVARLEVGAIVMERNEHPVRRMIEGFGQFKLAKELANKTKDLSQAEVNRYKMISQAFIARTHNAVGNHVGALDATDSADYEVAGQLDHEGDIEKSARMFFVLSDDFKRSALRKYSEEEITALYNLGMERAKAMYSEAVKASETGEKPDSEKFEHMLALLSRRISLYEKLAAAKGFDYSEQIAKMKEAKASVLYKDRRWRDLAVYVRDEIDSKYWNTSTSRDLRRGMSSFIPKELRGKDGRISLDIERIDKETLASRFDSMLRSASNHLFDHPWYVQVGSGIAGCAVGTALSSGPWGCAAGAVAGVSADMTASAALASETKQAFFANYSSTNWSEAVLNYSEGAAVSLLSTVGFKVKLLPIGTWGSKLGQGSTWRSFGSGTVNFGKGMYGMGVGTARTFADTGRFVFAKTVKIFNQYTGKKVLPEVAKLSVDRQLKSSAKYIWQIVSGAPRDLGPLEGLSIKERTLRFFRMIKWDPYAGNYVKSGFCGSLGGAWDTSFHIFERMSIPVIAGAQLSKKALGDKKDHNVLDGIEAFAWMFFATRIGVNNLGIDKGGTRLLFLLDRVQDVILQVTSGKVISTIDWQKAMLNYVSGSIPGQIRGRWLKNILGKFGRFTKGMEVKIAGFSSGKLAWSDLIHEEREVLKKLVPYINAEGLLVLRKTSEGIKVVKQNTISRKVVDSIDAITLTSEEWAVVRRLVRPLEFEMSHFSNASPLYRYLRQSTDRRAHADVLDKIAKMVGHGDVKVVVRNQIVFTKNGGKHLVEVGRILPSEQKMLREMATPLEYHPCEFIPGKANVRSLETSDPEAYQIVSKIYAMAGHDVGKPLMIQGGRVTSSHMLGEISSVFKPKILGTLTPQEEFALRRVMEGSFKKVQFVGGKEAVDEIKVKISGSLNMKGMLLFSLIHDTLLGTFYDEVRGQALMETSPGSMGTWTLMRSLTTLWPRELVKLHFGWDKKLAVFLDRLLGREFLDPIMTKWVNIWPEKAYWRETYDRAFKDESLSKFVDYHVASGIFSGGLFLYNLNTLGYAVNDQTPKTPYTPMPGSFGSLTDFLSSGKYKDKKLLSDADYVKLDKLIGKLLTETDKIIREGEDSKLIWIEDEYYRKDVVFDLALGVAASAYVANLKDPRLFKTSIQDHPQLFDFIGSAMGIMNEEGDLDRTDVVKFISDIVNDGKSTPPDVFQNYMFEERK